MFPCNTAKLSFLCLVCSGSAVKLWSCLATIGEHAPGASVDYKMTGSHFWLPAVVPLRTAELSY
jgi:hypothetical protein